jgi:hypothetical protein
MDKLKHKWNNNELTEYKATKFILCTAQSESQN